MKFKIFDTEPIFLFMIGFFFFSMSLWSQEEQKNEINLDSIMNLDQVYLLKDIPIFKKTNNINKSVEKQLEGEDRLGMIKRGSYAWEPTLNNMATERSVITIDGMRIFGACTDKMDPITSYVETNNLSDIEVTSGQAGSEFGATIAGNIDLKQKRVHYTENPQWKGDLQTGVETNNLQRNYSGSLTRTSDKFVSRVSALYRKANNYKDGRNNTINYSQYEKFNASANLGYKISSKDDLRADLIFDRAWNVGYPSLPMDVASARALISMMTYKRSFYTAHLQDWETKLYYNTIHHEMDDGNREPQDKLTTPMDMPGQSDTYGISSKLSLINNDISTTITFNGYRNLSKAEMVMYYSTIETMFTYTWPEVSTLYGGLTVNNVWDIDFRRQLSFGGSFGIQNNYVESDEGFRLNRIFHDFKRRIYRYLPSLNVSYQEDFNDLVLSLGLGYGQRAPSVSEAYGFYLFNNADGYDYMGNPNLKNETSYEINLNMEYTPSEDLKLKASTSYFWIDNYIFGVPFGKPNWQMTPLPDRRGLKMYEGLKHAQQFNANLEINYQVLQELTWMTKLNYSFGQDDEKRTLPFIRPFSYLSVLSYKKNNFKIEGNVQGDVKRSKFSELYGEVATPSYTTLNLSSEYTITFKNNQTALFQIGIDNLLNRYYTTYADWRNFPQMGRNFFVGVRYNFN